MSFMRLVIIAGGVRRPGMVSRIAAFASTAVFMLAARSAEAGVLMSYSADTGQTATAEFSFDDATTLRIILTETTPVSVTLPTAADGILTSVGFLLPDSAVIVGGSATIAAGSSSVGFDNVGGTQLTGGDDVSGEWGATVGGEKPIGNGSNYDFASGNTAQVTAFGGTNRDGPAVLDGPQGGLLDDSASRGGLGVIDNAIVLLLTLDADPGTLGNQGLSAAQQTAFLSSLATTSIVEWGSDFAFGTPDGQIFSPEPSSFVLAVMGSVGLVVLRWRRTRTA
jgi:hypothetical protein